jgi:hypothetical protein
VLTLSSSATDPFCEIGGAAVLQRTHTVGASALAAKKYARTFFLYRSIPEKGRYWKFTCVGFSVDLLIEIKLSPSLPGAGM